MGLAISVGLLYDQARNDMEGFEHHQRTFARLSQALADKGITWHEPEITDPPGTHRFSGGFSYEHLAHLRRAFALNKTGGAVTPATTTSEEQYKRDLQVVQGQTSIFYSHLLLHAGVDGYYIPAEFPDPAIRAGHSVGSSQRLLTELTSFASAIGISLDEEGRLPEEEAARLAAMPTSDPYEPEKLAWYQLHQACLASLISGHAVVFH
ncbi:hypothetical protein ACFQ71_20140 [Streptomyces sp. NPDC056534]|uniref:hypothetical protein n=1 Tax=Streptomyces sp. NPDC056534 TaxID=3345857 RepID=UPI00369F1176